MKQPRKMTMKLNAAQYEEAKALGFKAESHGGDHNAMSPFGEACYGMNDFEDIKNCRTDKPDATDMKNWNIDEAAWREGQEEAIEQAMQDYEDEQE